MPRALDAGQISGAAFDVVSVEPPPLDYPFMALLDRRNFLLTPHVAWGSEEAVQGLADQLIDNVEAFAKATLVNLVQAHQDRRDHSRTWRWRRIAQVMAGQCQEVGDCRRCALLSPCHQEFAAGP